MVQLIRSKNGALKEGQSGLLHLHAHAVSRVALIGRLLTPPKLPTYTLSMSQYVPQALYPQPFLGNATCSFELSIKPA